MTCKEIQENLEAFVDRECPRQVRKEITTHLSVCPHCLESWRQTVELRRLLRSLPPERCPSSVRERVWTQIVEEKKKRFCGFPSLGWRAIIGLTSGILVISLFIGLHLHHRSAPPYYQSQIIKAREGVELAFAYYRRATQLSTDITQRETIPPLRNGFKNIHRIFKKRRQL